MRAGATVRQHARTIAAARLGPLLRDAGDRLGLPPRATLALMLAGDDELRSLNHRFLGIDGPTDVLAFPSDEPGRIGDVAISVERAVQQAPGSAEDELRLLSVHGLLHCIGHDHADPEGARRMTAATRALLRAQTVPALVT